MWELSLCKLFGYVYKKNHSRTITKNLIRSFAIVLGADLSWPLCISSWPGLSSLFIRFLPFNPRAASAVNCHLGLIINPPPKTPFIPFLLPPPSRPPSPFLPPPPHLLPLPPPPSSFRSAWGSDDLWSSHFGAFPETWTPDFFAVVFSSLLAISDNNGNSVLDKLF